MKKIAQNEIILYLVFGIFTTIVYFILRFLIINMTDKSLLAVIVAQLGAILFAYVTNKLFVFKDKRRTGLVKQFIVFLTGRSFVLMLDLLITYIGVEKYSILFIQFFHLNQINYNHFIFDYSLTKPFIGSAELLNEFIFAWLVQVLAIVLNYVISKKKVFKKTS